MISWWCSTQIWEISEDYWIKVWRVGLESKTRYFRYVAYGLALIHKEGLIHKDFHSGNLVGALLNGLEFSNYYITDFGLCKPVGFRDSKIFGVLPYLAPEVLSIRYIFFWNYYDRSSYKLF